ncbi:flagellar biosynthesis protein FlhF [Bacillus mesophilum]|uniref:Flagellar biosynthesis protein FlhF n=1 Tax=Bacillus mesophilum TaxID=1071718 RepID=A0A7V7UWY5_9BACI|nr:flagellar biosynthesis protein FlhF [Bacillus mesophilum]KAB2335436.1 flagellar biosynthesis protein FlhF [Bacillus mesophilum]
MKVKKYVAESMPEAMKKIRSELGNDAVILNSRVIQTGGFLGFFKKQNIEVLAAADSKPEKEQKPMIKNKQSNQKDIAKFTLEGQKLPVNESHNDHILKELNDLKKLVGTMGREQNQNTAHLPAPLLRVHNLLHEQEIDQQVIFSIEQNLLEKWYASGESAEPTVEKWLESEMNEKLTNIPFGGISFQKKYVNVIGPTGVGKTTTLAKMAAECVMTHQKSVAFITADTYRIGAVEQLKTYAEILNVPLEVCYSLEEFNIAAEKFSQYDLVFIDTAGRNFRNKKYVEDLKRTIDFEHDMETFLVLSLTSKQRDMEEIYTQFSNIHIDRLVFTKADETSSYGAMFNLIYKHQKGAAYITNGQDVPDDLIYATPEAITKTIIGVDSNV